MAKQHHCPNDGAQPCNAAGAIIHVCPICYARWEEVIPEDKPTPPPVPKPATSPPSPSAAPKPAPAAPPAATSPA